ncbi:MAG: hypothetical protein HYZ51_02485 [Candidatus Doudnabacteria bacterium]|nr:hypothetical protein [Candidatus Doudnabacteria bacterium]
MTSRLAPEAVKNYLTAPVVVQKVFDKQVRFLERNIRHPSLRAKKYLEDLDLWQARVNKTWRFYFTIEDDAYVIQDIIKHPK